MVTQHASTGIAGFVEYPAADFENQPAFFQHLDELRWRLLTQLRVVPAQQHFGADYAIVTGVDLGLEVQGQFATGQGQAQVAFHAQAFAGGFLHGGVEQLGGVASGVFGPIQGNVGAFEQVGRGRAMIGNQGHADAWRNLQALTIEGHRFSQ
ncbi:hypothetical protein D3C78_695720 [compost metagenome]